MKRESLRERERVRERESLGWGYITPQMHRERKVRKTET